MRPINVAVIGLGYWGPNYLRVLSQINKVNVKYLCDRDKEKLSGFSTKSYELVSDYRVLADDQSLDAVFVVTPASTHFEIAKFMLESGKHVLVEKPLTMSYKEAVELCHLSDEVNRVLMVGHIYTYNPAIRYIKDMLNRGELGKLYYGVGLRMGFGPIRDDANCLWDLAPHELSILDYLLGEMPTYVSAQASSFLQRDKNIYDYAVAHIVYSGGFSFTLTVSWYSPEKIRLMTLIGSRKMVKFDDMNKSNPLMVYEKGASLEPLKPQADYRAYQVRTREGDTVIPYISPEEPLLLQVNHFIDCIVNNRRPLSDGYQGARVVAVLEGIEESIKKKGSLIEVSGGDLK
jgi:predicted dehydrogenase